MTLKKQHLPYFAYFYLLCFVVQWVGTYFTQMSVHDWYPQLDQSPLTPPGMVFGIVWSILYVFMAAAATRVYAMTKTWKCRPLLWWFIQLMLGLIWSIVFFGNQSILGGLIIICTNMLAVIITTILFWRVDEKAGALLLPLALWLTLATHLNLFIYLHN